jgi:hypothetical protein
MPKIVITAIQRFVEVGGVQYGVEVDTEEIHKCGGRSNLLSDKPDRRI